MDSTTSDDLATLCENSLVDLGPIVAFKRKMYANGTGCSVSDSAHIIFVSYGTDGRLVVHKWSECHRSDGPTGDCVLRACARLTQMPAVATGQ